MSYAPLATFQVRAAPEDSTSLGPSWSLPQELDELGEMYAKQMVLPELLLTMNEDIAPPPADAVAVAVAGAGPLADGSRTTHAGKRNRPLTSPRVSHPQPVIRLLDTCACTFLPHLGDATRVGGETTIA